MLTSALFFHRATDCTQRVWTRCVWERRGPRLWGSACAFLTWQVGPYSDLLPGPQFLTGPCWLRALGISRAFPWTDFTSRPGMCWDAPGPGLLGLGGEGAAHIWEET